MLEPIKQKSILDISQGNSRIFMWLFFMFALILSVLASTANAFDRIIEDQGFEIGSNLIAGINDGFEMTSQNNVPDWSSDDNDASTVID